MRITWTRTAIICSLALAALLVGCGSSAPAVARPTPTATTDPVTQTYLSLLRQYYTPLATDNIASRDCYVSVRNAATAQQSAQLATCKAPMSAELAAAQTLLTQLGKAAPPARLQAQNAALQQAVPGVIALTTTQLKAIEANDVNGFLATNHQAHDALLLFCDPINQINAGPPPVSPLLPVPDGSICNG